MTKGIHAGVGGTVRKSKPYVGVGGVVKKVKKVFVGIGGLPRLAYSAGISYKGIITPLSNYKYRQHTAGSNSNFAIFVGGAVESATAQNDAVTAYDTNLTRSTPDGTGSGYALRAFASIGNYAIFMGGRIQNVVIASSTIYDGVLTKSNLAAIPTAVQLAAGAKSANHAIIAGGTTSVAYWNTATSGAYAFDAVLNRTGLSVRRAKTAMAGASVGGNAIFAGGVATLSGTIINEVDIFNASLTRSDGVVLDDINYWMASGSTSMYAWFAGGKVSTSDSSNKKVYAYDSSLVKHVTSELLTHTTAAPRTPAVAAFNDYIIFAGQSNEDPLFSADIDVYDNYLVRQRDIPNLSEAVIGIQGTSIGNYALFAGGQGDTTNSDRGLVVEAYSI